MWQNLKHSDIVTKALPLPRGQPKNDQMPIIGLLLLFFVFAAL